MEVITRVGLKIGYLASLPSCLSGGNAVFPHKALEVRTLHPHIFGRASRIPIVSLKGMDEEVSLHLFYGFQLERFL